MSSTTAYERLVAASDVEAAVVSQLQKWLPSYLAEIDRQASQDVGTLPLPRSWVVSSDVEHMPEDQSTTIVVVSPGLTDPPHADGRGMYVARWQVDVAVQMSARGNTLALRLVRLYAAAIRGVLVQQQVLDGVDVRRIDWMGERYDELDSIDDRTTCIALVELAVEVADVTTRNAGPYEPLIGPDVGAPSPDSPVWPTAESVDIDVAPKP